MKNQYTGIICLTAACLSLFKPVSAIAQEASSVIAVQASAAASSPTKSVSDEPLQTPRGANGDGSVEVTGELKKWHKLTVNLSGPYAHERDNAPNPFTDFRMTATFTHTDGSKYVVPGYFAADGDAANSSQESGNVWRAHFAPDKTGDWAYSIAFHQGDLAAVDADAAAKPLVPYNGKSGSFAIANSDKQGRDLRARGRLQYVGKHYLQFAGSKEYFLKVGANAPRNAARVCGL